MKYDGSRICDAAESRRNHAFGLLDLGISTPVDLPVESGGKPLRRQSLGVTNTRLPLKASCLPIAAGTSSGMQSTTSHRIRAAARSSASAS